MMASYQDIMTSKPAISQAACASPSLTIMRADMIAALQNKQRGKRASTDPQPCPQHTGSSLSVLDEAQISRVIEMAWEDRTPFSAIEHGYGLNETAVIKLMRHTLKPSSFRLWRRRVSCCATKHDAKRSFSVGRAYCKTQYKPR